ncbi:hypothetical protein ACTJJ7_16530 [Phyllobacterium sp. 22229]|uniref:hypothetical protein n=1 Tax=Phyllobacterium sp. 22229 TaxID=3453895 RepID=UPI003F87FE6B
MEEAAEIADLISSVCAGKDTISVFIGLSMVIGAFEARAERPNLANLLDLIGQSAQAEFDRRIGEVH